VSYTITRYNAIGLMYTIEPIRPGVTRIRQKDRYIEVACDFEVINQAWYYWQQQRHTIQHAFSMLDPNEREFIQSGISPEEWDSLFGEDEA
jgi:hypothetical protein